MVSCACTTANATPSLHPTAACLDNLSLAKLAGSSPLNSIARGRSLVCVRIGSLCILRSDLERASDVMGRRAMELSGLFGS